MFVLRDTLTGRIQSPEIDLSFYVSLLSGHAKPPDGLLVVSLDTTACGKQHSEIGLSLRISLIGFHQPDVMSFFEVS